MSLVFYVSGHGFGHAARVIEVINVLGLRRPSLRIIVRTPAARGLFDRTLTTEVDFQTVDCDPGVVQRDSLSLDPSATIRRAAAFFDGLEERAAAEAAVLAAARARLVVCDIAPLGCAAARRAGVPSILLGNFTWDWIYAAFDEGRQAPALLASVRAACGLADEAWRLPMGGGFGGCRRIVDVPYIARHSRRPAGELRRLLAVPYGARLALASFGGFGLQELDERALAQIEGWIVVLTGVRHGALSARDGAIVRVDEEALAAAGFRYEDLVAASDVVVSKPGFGIIGECAANGAALVYTSRGRFAEYDVLVEEMARYLRCEFIPQDELLAGRWAAALDRVLARPDPPDRLPTNGAEVVAGRILERLGPS